MTGYRSILVHLDASPHSADRLDFARRLARRHEAVALTAVIALEPVERPEPLPVDIAPPIPPKVLEVDSEHRRRAVTLFNDAQAAGDPPMTLTEVMGVDPQRGLAQAALCADLTVLGQRDPNDPFSEDVPVDLVESVVVASGKPTLVVPFADRFWHIARIVTVAWRPTRECARAVEGAIPLMQRADLVRVVSWGKEAFQPVDGTLSVVPYLRIHGIEATAHRFPDEPVDLSEVLLAHAAEHESDLLVMGCYGHHRLRELLFGGVTRTVLRNMNLPVLMSH